MTEATPDITEMRLQDKTILVTRRPEQARELIREIEKEGGLALFFPTIEIKPPESWSECDERIDRLKTYDGIVFTSANAVVGFVQRCHARGVAGDLLNSLDVFAVGETTRQLLEQHGLHVREMPESYTASSLADMLNGKDVRGKRFLLPQGNIARDEVKRVLSESGAEVDQVIVYRTVAPEQVETHPVLEGLRDGAIDVVTFASPSAVTNFIQMLSPDVIATMPPTTTVAVIGPTTAAAAREAGLRVDIVARDSTSSGLVTAIADYYG